MSALPSELTGADLQYLAVTDHFKTELNKLRAGQASPALVEEILVEVYGSKMSLLQLASISVHEPRVIIISPWDVNALRAIEGALAAANLGTSPVVQGNLIRLSLPTLTEERRHALAKEVSKMLEEHRERSRKIREELRTRIDEKEKSGTLPEDAKFRLYKEIDRLTAECAQTLEELKVKKESQLLTV